MSAEGFYGADGRERVCSGGVTPPKEKPSFREYCKGLSETLDDLCCQMLAVGMPYELYWYGEPGAVDYFLGSVRYRNLLDNQRFHLQGVYTLKALQEVLQFTTSPKEIYPRAPLDLEAAKKPVTQESVEADMRAVFANLHIRSNDKNG